MREILFRGRSMAQGSEWLYGDVLLYENSAQIWETIEGRKHNSVVSIRTIGQFTGLTDKNGKKIFEGDIVKTPFRGNKLHIMTIQFLEGGFFVVPTNKAEFDKDRLWKFRISCENENFEVIGNIHDNPELLNT